VRSVRLDKLSFRDDRVQVGSPRSGCRSKLVKVWVAHHAQVGPAGKRHATVGNDAGRASAQEAEAGERRLIHPAFRDREQAIVGVAHQGGQLPRDLSPRALGKPRRSIRTFGGRVIRGRCRDGGRFDTLR
jgi:hypothetical protein